MLNILYFKFHINLKTYNSKEKVNIRFDIMNANNKRNYKMFEVHKRAYGIVLVSKNGYNQGNRFDIYLISIFY